MNIQAAIYAGLFTKFVYDNWNKSTDATNLDGRPVVTDKGLPVVPGKNYHVLKTIYSNDLATDFDGKKPLLDDYKTIGIVAQNTADEADIYVAIRGTQTAWEWIQDFKFLLRTFPSVHGSGLTEDGFTDMYLSFSLTTGKTSGFMEEVAKALPSNAMVTVTGHSLGAALATLFALDMAANTRLPVGLYTIASPRVGDLSFHHLFNHVVPNAYRVHNRLDIVTKTPPPLLYWHVGDETELIPGKTLKFDLACEHHLTSYLNMLGALINEQDLYPLDADCVKAGGAATHAMEA